MYMEQPNNKVVLPDHSLGLVGRKLLDLTGVKKVETFDHEEFLLDTVMGYLVVRGSDLTMKNFDMSKGTVSIGGRVNEILYIEDQPGEKAKGFFSKLFK